MGKKNSGETSQKQAKAFRHERVDCPFDGCNWNGLRRKAPRHLEKEHQVPKQESVEHFQLNRKQYA